MRMMLYTVINIKSLCCVSSQSPPENDALIGENTVVFSRKKGLVCSPRNVMPRTGGCQLLDLEKKHLWLREENSPILGQGVRGHWLTVY